MKKTIRITESQFFNLVDKKKNLIELEMSPAYREHWEHKFEKSVQILLKLGHSIDELMRKIQNIAGINENLQTEQSELQKHSMDENFKINGHEFNVIKMPEGSIYVGKDGILGDNNVIISWNVINKLMKKYKHL